MTEEYRRANYQLWNERAEPHFETAFYDVPGFKNGKSSLTPIEREALGDVSGKTLLHLQCHFGQDTLSWAREGAIVTGVDFSEKALALAASLSTELNLPARFIRSDLYELPTVLDERFDVVFTSYGVLKWLPDIAGWGRIVARYLKPGGTFFIVEFHPFLYVFDYDKAERIEHSYFYDPEPITYDEVGTYADPGAQTAPPAVRKAHAWMHGVSSVITALIDAGLRIETFREYPYSTIDCFPFVREEAPGRYVHRTHPEMVPILYAVRATKPL